jgi:hypothetical protein
MSFSSKIVDGGQLQWPNFEHVVFQEWKKQNNQGKLLVQLGLKKTDIKIMTFSKIQYNPFFIVNVTVYDNWNI